MEEKSEEVHANMKGEELEFTYNLGDKFRIDIDGARKRKEEREQESKKNFEELKKQMEESAAKSTPVVSVSEKLQSSEVRQKPPVDEEGDQIEDEVEGSFADDDGIEDFYGDDTFKKSKQEKTMAAGAEVGIEEEEK